MLSWFKKTFGGKASSGIPEGWTDDMAVELPPGRTCSEVVTLVLESALRNTSDSKTEDVLMAEFDLSPEDAALARDGVFGGLVRSAMRDSAPSQAKDPIAWESYKRRSADPSLVRKLYPHFASQG